VISIFGDFNACIPHVIEVSVWAQEEITTRISLVFGELLEKEQPVSMIEVILPRTKGLKIWIIEYG
jgi:hypothetical protein